MLPTVYHPQRKAQHGSGGTLRCGMGRAAPIADGYQFQVPARCEKPRVHCRGRSTPRTFYSRTAGGRCIGDQRRRADTILLPVLVRRKFTPRALTLDEILELRLCDLTGRQPVINRSRLDTLGNQPPTQIADASTHFPARLSSTAVAVREGRMSVDAARAQAELAKQLFNGVRLVVNAQRMLEGRALPLPEGTDQ